MTLQAGVEAEAHAHTHTHTRSARRLGGHLPGNMQFAFWKCGRRKLPCILKTGRL